MMIRSQANPRMSSSLMSQYNTGMCMMSPGNIGRSSFMMSQDDTGMSMMSQANTGRSPSMGMYQDDVGMSRGNSRRPSYMGMYQDDGGMSMSRNNTGGPFSMGMYQDDGGKNMMYRGNSGRPSSMGMYQDDGGKNMMYRGNSGRPSSMRMYQDDVGMSTKMMTLSIRGMTPENNSFRGNKGKMFKSTLKQPENNNGMTSQINAGMMPQRNTRMKHESILGMPPSNYGTTFQSNSEMMPQCNAGMKRESILGMPPSNYGMTFQSNSQMMPQCNARMEPESILGMPPSNSGMMPQRYVRMIPESNTGKMSQGSHLWENKDAYKAAEREFCKSAIDDYIRKYGLFEKSENFKKPGEKSALQKLHSKFKSKFKLTVKRKQWREEQRRARIEQHSISQNPGMMPQSILGMPPCIPGMPPHNCGMAFQGNTGIKFQGNARMKLKSNSGISQGKQGMQNIQSKNLFLTNKVAEELFPKFAIESYIRKTGGFKRPVALKPSEKLALERIKKTYKSKQRFKKKQKQFKENKRIAKIEKFSDKKVDLTVAFDISYLDGSLMTPQGKKKVFKQVYRCQNMNANKVVPVKTYIVGAYGDAKEFVSRGKSLVATIHEKSLLDAFKLEDLVYLTNDSENVIEKLDESKIYVIGAVIERGKFKGQTMKMATDNNISHVRFPIEKYYSKYSGRTLSVNQTFAIISNIAHGRTWEEAFRRSFSS